MNIVRTTSVRVFGLLFAFVVAVVEPAVGAAQTIQGPRIQRMMEEFLIQRERTFSGGATDERVQRDMLRLLDSLEPPPGTVDPMLDLQIKVFRHKGYSFLAHMRWTGAPMAQQRATQILGVIRPSLKNVTYDDWGALKVVYRGDATRQEIALTYDDGPFESGTPQLLELLREFGARATFFCVGKQAKALPHLVRRIHQEGHLLANHTWSHARAVGLPRLEPEAIREEVDLGQKYICEAVGLPKLEYFRLPYGAGLSSKRVNGIVAEYHPYNVFWTIDTRDWKKVGAAKIARSILGSNQLNGAIVLMHDHAPGTVAATREVLSTLTPQGYRFVTMEELIGVDPREEFLYGLTQASIAHSSGQHKLAFDRLVQLSTTPPTLALSREILDYAYQIARGFLGPTDADEARNRLAATLRVASR